MSKEIKTSNGYIITVDDEDFSTSNSFRWIGKVDRKSGAVYASRTVRISAGRKTTSAYLHRVLMSANRGEIVDHRNGNTLDNRRKNLRICTNSQNLMNRGKQKNNTTGFKGVSKVPYGFRATLKIGGKQVWSKNFKTAQDASNAYLAKAAEIHGGFFHA